MDAVRHPVAAEQHDAQESGFQEKRREDFVSQRRARDVARLLHVAGPVGAELEAHGDARHHTEREGEGENLGPQVIRHIPSLRRRRALYRAVAHAEKHKQNGSKARC